MPNNNYNLSQIKSISFLQNVLLVLILEEIVTFSDLNYYSHSIEAGISYSASPTLISNVYKESIYKLTKEKFFRNETENMRNNAAHLFALIGYFKMIDLVDKFIFLDNVQLNKRSFQTRNKIKCMDNELFISVPIKKIKREDSLIKDVEIDGEKWVSKHLNSILHSYSKSKYFLEVFDFISKILKKKNSGLSNLNCTLIINISRKLGISTEFEKASSTTVNNLNKEDKLIQICKEFEFDNYLSPINSSTYIENKTENKFKTSNINLYYYEYFPRKYNQLGKKIYCI